MDPKQVLIETSKICQENLHNNRQALDYLISRGLDLSSINKWEIGLFPTDISVLTRTIPLVNLEQMQIAYDAIKSPFITWNKITHRKVCGYITFPLRNQYGELVALSGRPPISNDDVKKYGCRKYYHTSFDKAKFAYGLDKAIPFIRQEGIVIVGEGQFDTITANRLGIGNVVSTCGTAFTFDHFKILSRYAEHIVIVFDSDEAGEKARRRVLETCQRPDTELHFALLGDITNKEDIDSYLLKYPKEQFTALINKSLAKPTDNSLDRLLQSL